MPVVTASTIVRIIITIYATEGIILCFFFMAFKCPEGVDRKQLPAMFKTWQTEKIIAQTFTSKEENTKMKVRIHEIKNPTIEQAKNPMILCL